MCHFSGNDRRGGGGTISVKSTITFRVDHTVKRGERGGLIS